MLQVRERRHQDVKTLTLIGQFNHKTMTGIKAMILASPEAGFHHTLLDFSMVTEIDSTSLSDLFLWYHSLKSPRVKISVVKPAPYFRYHEDWAHLAEIVSIYSTAQEVIDQVGS